MRWEFQRDGWRWEVFTDWRALLIGPTWFLDSLGQVGAIYLNLGPLKIGAYRITSSAA